MPLNSTPRMNKGITDEQLEKLKAKDGTCFENARKNNELTFTLVEHDLTSPMIIVDWIRYNLRNCRAEKLHQALDVAIAMAHSPKRRHAD